MDRLEELKQMMTGERPSAPIAQFLGIETTSVEEGHIVVELDVTDELHNPMGTLHGGVLCDVADLVMGYTFYSTLAEDELFTTVEIKTNFMKPIWEGILRAESNVIKKGGTIGLVDCHIYDENESLVAYSTSTCMILKGSAGSKRAKL